MTPTTMFILCGDQPTAIEGVIILMMIGIPWVVIPEPTKSTMVASMKMIVVIANTKICPGEFNKDPLELQKKCERAPKCLGENEKHEAHRSILIEMQYMARNIPKCRERWMIRRASMEEKD